jgi:hypothetical protein
MTTRSRAAASGVDEGRGADWLLMRVVLSKTSPSVRGARAARRAASLLLLAASVLLCAHLSAARASAATPLAVYRDKVRQAAGLTDDLVTFCEVNAQSGSSGPAEEESKYLADVRALLPPSEKVEWGGTTTVVNNAWLHAALDEFEKMPAGAPSDNLKRARRIEGVSDRLRALEARLAETAAQPAAPRDKDAEKGRLATILRGKEYNREVAEGGAIQRLFKRIRDWLADLMPDMRPIRPGAGRPSRLVQYLVFALALAAVLYIVWKYWVRRRDRIRPVAPREARVVLGERIEADRTASDLLEEAELLAREGELRGAIRKAYVALLCELGDRKVIRLAQHKTNRDYLRAVRKDAPPRLYEEMQPLTNNFERHWYGLEEADQSDWADFRTRCRQALNFK